VLHHTSQRMIPPHSKQAESAVYRLLCHHGVWSFAYIGSSKRSQLIDRVRIEVTAPAANVLTAVRNLDANVVHSIFRANLKHLAKKYILLTEQLLGGAGSWKERTSH
jgi:hypothetical protein